MTAYSHPRTLDAALELLSERPMTIAAGCTDLFPATTAKTLSGPVLDISGLDEIRGIERDETGIRIGAATTWTELLRSNLPPAFDMLKQAAREVGSVQIQNAGTLAGNICNASPAADGVPCLLALDASVEIARRGGVRTVPVSAFITGVRETDLAEGEIVTAITIPAASLGGRSRFLKLGARTYLVISIAMVAVRLRDEAGGIAEAAISVGACGPVATRLTEVEAGLVGQALTTATNLIDPEAVRTALSPINDLRADADYRATAAAELVRRAIADLASAGDLAA